MQDVAENTWDPFARGCPSRDVLTKIGDRWTVLVINALARGSLRRGRFIPKFRHGWNMNSRLPGFPCLNRFRCLLIGQLPIWMTLLLPENARKNSRLDLDVNSNYFCTCK